MHPWERIEASSDGAVVDLSDGAFSFPDVAEAEAPTLVPEDQTWLDRIRAAVTGKGGSGEGEGDGEAGKGGDSTLSADEQAEAQAALDAALAEPEGEGEAETPEPVAAALSDEDREKIELANTRAANAEKDAADARAKANAAEWKAESAELVRDGVPPADVELARPLLEHGDPDVVELSSGDKVDAAKIVRQLLASRKGTVDFSEVGSTDGEGTERAEAKALAKQLGEQFGGDTPKAGDG